MEYTQNTNCLSWQFFSVPAFSCGNMSKVFADCGPGLKDDLMGETGESSYMHKFSDVETSEITGYVSALADSGFLKLYENEIEGNLFWQFKVSDGFLYISYFRNLKTARFILDRCNTTPAGFFGYDKFEEKCQNTEFVQYSLHYDKMIKGTTCDCGMNYIYRLRDNSLIIIDSGEMEQATDISVKDYMELLEELTGTKSGEKIRISLWLCTHSHNDHMDFFSKLMLLYHDRLTVERAAFNFPLNANTKGSLSVSKMKERLSEYYPDITYIKFHAGCSFSIANADVCILTAAEETIDYGTEDPDPFPGTNSSCAVFSVTVEGIRTLFLADASDDNSQVLIKSYSSALLKSEFLQAAHHGINSIYDAYETIETKKLLLPQCLMNMETRFEENYRHYCARYGEENIIMANNRTDIFTLCNGTYITRFRKHVGTAYDGSEW